MTSTRSFEDSVIGLAIELDSIAASGEERRDRRRRLMRMRYWTWRLLVTLGAVDLLHRIGGWMASLGYSAGSALRAFTSFERGEFAETVRHAERVVDPGVELRRVRIAALGILGRGDAMRAAVDDAIRAFPDDPRLRVARMRARVASDPQPPAFEEIETLAAGIGDDAGLIEKLVVVAADLAERDRAQAPRILDWLREMRRGLEALGVSVDDERWSVEESLVLFAAGHEEDAIELFDDQLDRGLRSTRACRVVRALRRIGDATESEGRFLNVTVSGRSSSRDRHQPPDFYQVIHLCIPSEEPEVVDECVRACFAAWDRTSVRVAEIVPVDSGYARDRFGPYEISERTYFWLDDE